MTREQFEELLKRHDWYYEATDDMSKYVKGHAMHQHLLKLLSLYPEYEDLYEKYEKTMNND
jgi:hypothetical protein